MEVDHTSVRPVEEVAETRGWELSRCFVHSKSFAPPGGDREAAIVVEANPRLSFENQLSAVAFQYRAALRELGLEAESAVHRRIYLSDAVNRGRAAQLSLGSRHGDVAAISIIDQAPLPAKLALLAYHVTGNERKTQISDHHLLVERHGSAHLWTTGLQGRPRVPACAASETGEAFAALRSVLAEHGGSLADNCVRTWIYVADIDAFYPSVNAARASALAHEGLTAATHFIASTGIGGGSSAAAALVTVDALSILGLDPAQVSYPNDFFRLCRTSEYGVTFERATRIAWADRSHVHLSGTASIDRYGHIVYPGDVLAQLDRALENAAALLAVGGAALDDLLYLVAYVRDPTDCERVRRRLAETAPTIPAVVVAADICRPGWLVEIEGVAATPAAEPTLPPF